MKALVLLNMGGARNKDELGTFLRNMFNDKNILTIENDYIRSMVASLIVTLRHEKAWENYEKIGGASPLHDLTDELIVDLQENLPDFFVTCAMRYTSPFAQTAIERIKKQGIKDIILLPLYPQYSTTTTKSSIDDFLSHIENEEFKEQFNIKICEPFYKNQTYNQIICNEIIKQQGKYKDFHLIFSAHGLPEKIIKKGDPYKKQIEEHIEILKELLSHYATTFKSINLAYQSKVGPMKWLRPSLDETLKHLKGKKVIVYPISFIIDNSETAFELDIEYREIAFELELKEYKVCKCVNNDSNFIETVKEIIKDTK